MTLTENVVHIILFHTSYILREFYNKLSRHNSLAKNQGCNMVYGFCDLGGLHSSATVHGFLKGWLILGETAILVWFYALDYFGYFCFINFPVFLIMGDSIDLPQCMNFYSFGGLGFLKELTNFWGKLQFWSGFMLLIILDVFVLRMGTLWILWSLGIT